ncbi:hypothetical protein AB0D30_38140 [Streptomyces sp. NPDC048409]
MTDERQQDTRSRPTASRRRASVGLTHEVRPVLAVPIPGGAG